jgi:hypothetical protein
VYTEAHRSPISDYSLWGFDESFFYFDKEEVNSMPLTLTLPDTLGPTSGPRNDGVLRGQVALEDPDRVFYRGLSHTGGKYYTIDSGGGENEVDVTSSTSIQMFPTAGSGNLSVNDAFEFALTKTEFDDGIRIVGLHVDVSTAAQNLTFNVVYFANDDTWKTAPNLIGLSTFLTTTGDSHVHFDTPSDWASITHTVGTSVTRVYPFRLVITVVGGSPVAPICTLKFSELDVAGSANITSLVTTRNIAQANPHIIEGDAVDTITQTAPVGLEVNLWRAQLGGTNAYEYWNGTAFVSLPNVDDPSLLGNRENNQTATRRDLTSTATSAVATTTLAIEDGGYVEAVLPSDSDETMIGLRAIDGTTDWMIGISGGNIIVTENGATKYTHGTVPAVNSNLRVWYVFGDNAIVYHLDDTVVYTSTVIPDQGLNGRFTAAASGTSIDDIALVQFNTQDAYPISSATSATGFTESTDAPAQEEFPASYKVKWTVPSDWVPNTVEDSPNAYAGYHFRVKKVGTFTQSDRISHVRSMYRDAVRATGLDLGSSQVFRTAAVKFHEITEFTEDIVLEVINLDSQVAVTVTLAPESDQPGEADDDLSEAISFSQGHRLMVRQISGRVGQYIGSGDLILS